MAERNASQRVDDVLGALTPRYRAVATIARMAECGETTVRNLLHARYEAGEIDVDRSGWPHRYRLKPRLR
jgi:hypothetical protein